MEEKNIVMAKTSVSPVEKSSTNTKQQSLMGSLLPLIAPVCVLLYMWITDIRFNALGGYAKCMFWGGFVASAILYYFHQKAVQLEDEKVKEAERVATNQSLIVTNQRIYGNNGQSSFSYAYNDIIKAYSTMVQGSTPQLAIRLCDGSVLMFKYIENLQTVISCINDAKKNSDSISSSIKEIKKEIKEEMPVELFNVVISSSTGSVQQIKALRQITFFDLPTAKNVLSNLPYTIAESLEKEVAENLKLQLEKTGMQIILIKQ